MKNLPSLEQARVLKRQVTIGGLSLSYVSFFIFISSDRSSCATETDIPDPLSPLLPIVHRLWQVFRATSRILT